MKIKLLKVKSRVVNLKEINSDITIEAVVDTLINKVLKLKKKDLYTLGKKELKKIQKLKDERFGLWEWNYGKTIVSKKQRKLSFKGNFRDYF